MIVFFMSGEDNLLGGFWFLRALFWGALLSLVTIRVFNNKPWAGGIILIVLMCCMKALKIKVPFLNINDWMIIAALFHFVGYVFGVCEVKGLLLIKESNKIILALVFLFTQLFLISYYPTDIFAADFSEVIPCLIMSLLGVLSSFLLCDYLSERHFVCKKIVDYIGRHTLIILAWHFLVFKFVSYIIITIYQYPISYLGYFPSIPNIGMWWVLYSVTGVIVPVSLYYVICKISKKISYILK